MDSGSCLFLVHVLLIVRSLIFMFVNKPTTPIDLTWSHWSKYEIARCRNLCGLLGDLKGGASFLPRGVLERFEARAGWVSASNAGLIAHKHYHLTFVGCLGESKHLRRHEEIMRRPEVSTRWDAAVTIDNLHTTDLYVDNDQPPW